MNLGLILGIAAVLTWIGCLFLILYLHAKYEDYE